MRYTQPQSGPPNVDWANPLTRSLVIALVPGMPDSVSGSLATQSGSSSLGTNQVGRAFTSPATQTTGNFKYAVSIPSSFDCTLLRVHSCVTANTPAQSVPTLELNSAELVQACDTAGLSQFSTTGNASGNISIAAAGNISVIAGVKAVNSQLSYFNGKLLDTSVTGNRAIGAITQVSVGRSSGNQFENVKYSLLLYWTRALSAAEVAQISANPWQLFKSPQRVMLASAPSAPTGTFASTLGSVTLAASGTATDVGSFASTLGNATMAASGTVGSVPSGTFASTLDGFTMAATGTLNDSGAFASTLAGVSMGAAGTVAPNVTGTFASTMGDVMMSAGGYVGTPPVITGVILRRRQRPRVFQRQ
jgi:hypothetical protein